MAIRLYTLGVGVGVTELEVLVEEDVVDEVVEVEVDELVVLVEDRLDEVVNARLVLELLVE